MSKQLLHSLNGNNAGSFHQWLTDFNGSPRIAWYPSAGTDFHDLLYIGPEYSKIHKPFESLLEPLPPDIFLHTDYFPYQDLSFLESKVAYKDDHTSVLVKSIEELPQIDLPLDTQIVDFPERSDTTGRVLFLTVEIESNALGKFTRPVLYACVENAAFCAERILPLSGRISHVVHVRFGGGCGGGGKSTGIWLLNVLDRLYTDVLVTDNHYGRQRGDERIYELYPELSGPEAASAMHNIRVLPGEKWSNHGDITWKIRPCLNLKA